MLYEQWAKIPVIFCQQRNEDDRGTHEDEEDASTVNNSREGTTDWVVKMKEMHQGSIKINISETNDRTDALMNILRC